MKPSDLFLGLFEFFAIVLPGAILMYLLLLPDWPPAVTDVAGRPLTESGAKWAAFAVAAYALGHLLHFLSSFLDSRYYDSGYRRSRRFNKPSHQLPDAPRRETIDEAEKDVAAAEKLFKSNKSPANKSNLARVKGRLATLTEEKDGPPTPYQKQAATIVREERKTHLKSFKPPASENLYSWVVAALRVRNPAAATELERAGVDSKFFRSLILVSAFAAVWLPGILLLPPLDETTKLSVAIFVGCVVFCALCWLSFELSWSWFRWLVLVWGIAVVVVLILSWSVRSWPKSASAAIWSCSLSLLLCRLSYERFCKRRWDAAEDAYRYFILQSIPQPPAVAKEGRT
jgi:hypothetical protein